MCVALAQSTISLCISDCAKNHLDSVHILKGRMVDRRDIKVILDWGTFNIV